MIVSISCDLLDFASGKPYLTDVILCHCGVVNDETVRDAYDNGAKTLGELCRRTGAGQDCGSCVLSLKRALCQHEESARARFLEVEGEAS